MAGAAEVVVEVEDAAGAGDDQAVPDGGADLGGLDGGGVVFGEGWPTSMKFQIGLSAGG